MRAIGSGALRRICGLQKDEIKEDGETYMNSRRSTIKGGGEKDMQHS
jgi:hypothetical protein